jgi:hypothetical protein
MRRSEADSTKEEYWGSKGDALDLAFSNQVFMMEECYHAEGILTVISLSMKCWIISTTGGSNRGRTGNQRARIFALRMPDVT